jgi:hypothetical protein
LFRRCEPIDLPIRGDGGDREDTVAPDNRRGMALAGEFSPPLDVLPLAPLDWRIAVRRNAIGQGPAPLMPVVHPLAGEIIGRAAATGKRRCEAAGGSTFESLGNPWSGKADGEMFSGAEAT